MNDFIKWLALCFALVAIVYGVILMDRRVLALEEAVYNRPLGNCVEMHDLLKNRPYPPKHGVHSHARPVPLCEEP